MLDATLSEEGVVGVATGMGCRGVISRDLGRPRPLSAQLSINVLVRIPMVCERDRCIDDSLLPTVGGLGGFPLTLCSCVMSSAPSSSLQASRRPSVEADLVVLIWLLESLKTDLNDLGKDLALRKGW